LPTVRLKVDEGGTAGGSGARAAFALHALARCRAGPAQSRMADDGGEPDEFLYKVLVVGEVRAFD
jgi:hypothetical protein